MTDLNNRRQAERDAERYGVWCVVSGGVTGHREAWLKRNDKICVFETMKEAEQAAAEAQGNANASANRTANFSYTAREYF